MLLWIGLGNPGPSHAGHRHNVGFMAVEAIARAHGFAPWRRRRDFHGRTAEGSLDGVRVLMLEPETYMNDSGRAAAAAARFYRLEPDRVTAFHDEIDLAPGKVRVKQGGGSAGHNGLRSLDAHLGNGYWRVRLGIGDPGHPDLVTRHVLGDFARADRAWLAAMLDAVAAAAPLLASGEAERFMTKVAHLAPPPKPAEDTDDGV
ncbi:MAG: aminoacyl-tRNA hydrolase [Alphaproteobacteria bacterium]